MFANEFEAVIEFLGELKNHESTLENCNVSGVAIGVGGLGLDVSVGLNELDVFVFCHGEVVGTVNVAGANHAGSAE